jgi:uncharacterized protein
MSRSQRLYDLQRTDIELEAVVRRLHEIAASLGESSVLTQARQQVADAEAQLHHRHIEAKDLDLEVRSLTERIQANEKRLYSGRVTSPKELSSLQDDTASLKRYRAKKEESQLEAMFGEEEAEAALTRAGAALTETTRTWQAEQSQLLAEQADLQAQQQAVEDQRAFFAAAVPADDMTTYDRLRARKGGRAVAAIKGGICQGCHMPPPLTHMQQARAGPELVFCNNCGRIMHVL